MNRVYSALQIREIEQLAIQEYGVAGYELMTRAGHAVFNAIQHRWPNARSICIMCGSGNNAGDGYVVARLCVLAGWHVTTLTLSAPEELTGDAATAWQAYQQSGGMLAAFEAALPPADIYVDALLGTGLTRQLTDSYLQAVQALNAQQAPIVAIDIPTGLHADTGNILGEAVNADLTVTFIGWKIGLLTGKARDYCGELILDALELPIEPIEEVQVEGFILTHNDLPQLLPARPKTAHKGMCGHSVLIGGAPSMSGAIQLAGCAALRTGSGLVSLATHANHSAWINLNRPELMVHSILGVADLKPLLERATSIGIGVGLGQNAWAKSLWEAIIPYPLPKVMDADALNLLARYPHVRQDWILTPHPAEAGRLLGWSTSIVEQNRLKAVKELQAQYGGVVVLKGAGTLIATGESDTVLFCTEGNAGMASGGMGDVLTGIITSLLAQGICPTRAAYAGVIIHAHAADLAAQEGERGLLASDVIQYLRTVVNGK